MSWGLVDFGGILVILSAYAMSSSSDFFLLFSDLVNTVFSFTFSLQAVSSSASCSES